MQIISSPLNLHSRPSSVLLYSLHDHKVWGGRIFCLMYTCRELIPGSVTSVFDHRYDYYCGPGHIHSSGSDTQTSQFWVFSIHTSHPGALCHQGQCSRDEYDQIYSPQLQCFLCSWWLVIKPIQAKSRRILGYMICQIISITEMQWLQLLSAVVYLFSLKLDRTRQVNCNCRCRLFIAIEDRIVIWV